LCRVISVNDVYQYIKGVGWHLYSINTDYVDELEMQTAFETALPDSTNAGDFYVVSGITGIADTVSRYDYIQSPAAQTADTKVLMAADTKGGTPSLKDLSDFQMSLTAGNGIGIASQTISAIIDPSSDNEMTLSAAGLKVDKDDIEHTSGAEKIAGGKTFSGAVLISGTLNAPT
jgi:hypothetical protein